MAQKKKVVAPRPPPTPPSPPHRSSGATDSDDELAQLEARVALLQKRKGSSSNKDTNTSIEGMQVLLVLSMYPAQSLPSCQKILSFSLQYRKITTTPPHHRARHHLLSRSQTILKHSHRCSRILKVQLVWINIAITFIE